MQRTNKFNPKRRLHSSPLTVELADRLAILAAQVQYGGSPHHKRSPGDFGLTPPAQPRLGKSLCDDAAVTRKKTALSLLRSGLRRGMVDSHWNGEGWPRNIWAMDEKGHAFEAQNDTTGSYHGYPMPDADPFKAEVLRRWKAADA